MSISVCAGLLLDVGYSTFAFVGVWHDLAVEEFRVFESATWRI